MAWEQPLQCISLIAATDLSAKQFYAVKVDSNGKAALAGAGERAAGILQNDPASGKVANVMALGVSKAVYGASVTAGAELEVDANGKLITASTGKVVGIALESGSANEIHSVLLK